MHGTLKAIDELQRLPAPCPAPLGLACDGPQMWIASVETRRLYGIDSHNGTVFEEAEMPGTPYGMTVLGDTLRVVIGDDDNNRSIHRYIVGRHFKSDAIAAPDATGSFLAYDGDRLYLSQRYHKRILELDETGAVVRALPVPREICGMVVVEGRFYLMTTESKEVDDFRVVRLDPRDGGAHVEELASVPFTARSLAWDGTRFWTNARAENTTVAFARPD